MRENCAGDHVGQWSSTSVVERVLRNPSVKAAGSEGHGAACWRRTRGVWWLFMEMCRIWRMVAWGDLRSIWLKLSSVVRRAVKLVNRVSHPCRN